MPTSETRDARRRREIGRGVQLFPLTWAEVGQHVRMSLRSISDLDLAALVGGLHELALYCGAVDLCPRVIGGALRGAVAEVLARKACEPAPERLFTANLSVPVGDLKEFREAVAHCAARLDGKGFEGAAALLRERAVREVSVDVSEARPHSAGAELRYLN